MSFSIQRWLGQEDRFFQLLEASAQEARNSVQALARCHRAGASLVAHEDFAQMRWRDKRITQQIQEAVCTTFITALEREDIESLSNALYKIPKTVEKFTDRLLLAPQQVRGVDFTRQIQLLAQATDLVLEMVKALRRGMDLEQLKALNDSLQVLEGEADKLMIGLYQELYSGQHNAIKTLLLKDLYELLEKAMDRCRDAGNVMSHIALKNS